jgi:hypothetical protein
VRRETEKERWMEIGGSGDEGTERQTDAFYKGEVTTLKIPGPYPLVFW